MNITYFMTGWYQVSVRAEYAAALLEAFRISGIPYSGFTACPDGGIALQVRPAPLRKLTATCNALEIPLDTGDIKGLPALLWRLSHRLGVVIGLSLGLVLMILSSRIVWDIRVSGTQSLSARDVKDTLAACGFSVGTSFKGFAADVTENKALMQDKRLAWISINRRGCVAYVQVREATYAPEEETPSPANLVAARAGVIERVELVKGNLLVSAGQTVDEGQLLISGLYDSDRVGFRWTHAEGRVYARTVREFLIEVPLVYQQTDASVWGKGTEERPEREFSLIFFGKHIKFSKKTGNDDGLCDTIESEKNFSLVPGVGFPISLRTTWYLPRDEHVQTVTRTPEEAEEMAYWELARRISEIPGGAELIRKTVTPVLTDDCFRLSVTLVCVEDIARESVFEITE